MEIPVTAGPWLVLGLVLGTLLPVLGALVVLLRRRPGRDGADVSADTGPVVDDLPAFLESPPGSEPAAPPAAAGWPALAPPGPHPAAEPVRRDRSGSAGVLAAMVLAGLLLIGAAAAAATFRAPGSASAGHPGATAPVTSATPDTPADPGTSAEPAPGGEATGSVSAELAFESIVLERHAVGVTVAAPRVRITATGREATADIELVTFNCLRDDAPADPAAAGCTRSVTEYAELSTPELRVHRGDTLRVSGAFATWRRPSGSAPVSTGRVYELVVTAGSRDGGESSGARAATGLLELGDERARAREDGTSVLTRGD